MDATPRTIHQITRASFAGETMKPETLKETITRMTAITGLSREEIEHAINTIVRDIRTPNPTALEVLKQHGIIPR